MGSSHSRVKPKTMELTSTVSPLSTQHKGVWAKTGHVAVNNNHSLNLSIIFISKCVTDRNILHTYSPRVWYLASLLSTPSLRLEQTDCLVVRIVCVRVERHVYLWNVVSQTETVRLNNINTFLIQWTSIIKTSSSACLSADCCFTELALLKSN
jgi:hypothetical protein